MSAVRAMEDACGVAIDDGPIRDAAAAALLRRVDREPRAARLPAARARLPRLRERDRDGRRPPRGRRARAADEEDRQRADGAWSAGARSIRSTCASAASTARPTRAELRAAGRAARARARGGARDRALDGDAAVPGLRARPRAGRAARRRRVPDRPRPDRLHRRARHRAARVRRLRSSRSTSRTRTRCTPASAAAAPTSPARSRASTSTSTRCRRWRARRRCAAGVGPTCRNPFQSIVVRSVEMLYACDEALRIIAAYEPPDRPAVEVRAARRRSASGSARRRAACSSTATRSTTRARSSTRGSCRRPRRTSSRSSTTCARSCSAHVRPARRRAAAPLRAGDPQPRPVHLVRDALPDARCRAHVSAARGHRRRQRGARRRRRRPDRRPARSDGARARGRSAGAAGRVATARTSAVVDRRGPLRRRPGHGPSLRRRPRRRSRRGCAARRRPTRSGSPRRSSWPARSGRLPARLIVYGIEGERFEAGTGADARGERRRRGRRGRGSVAATGAGSAPHPDEQRRRDGRSLASMVPVVITAPRAPSRPSPAARHELVRTRPRSRFQTESRVTTSRAPTCSGSCSRTPARWWSSTSRARIRDIAELHTLIGGRTAEPRSSWSACTTIPATSQRAREAGASTTCDSTMRIGWCRAVAAAGERSRPFVAARRRAGSRAMTVVPAPGADSTVSVPPSSSTRSRIPSSPKPSGVAGRVEALTVVADRDGHVPVRLDDRRRH